MEESTRKENMKVMTIYMSIIIAVFASYILMYIYSMKSEYNKEFLDAASLAISNITSGKLFFPFYANCLIGLAIGIIIGGIAFLAINNDNIRHYKYDPETVAGSGGFMSKKEMQQYADEFISKDPPAIIDNLPIKSDLETDKDKYSGNMIMSYKFCRPINSRKLIGNNNILIVGGAGTGKSRFFIKPNVLQMNASYVITDPSGEMIFSLGKTLKEHGYKIKIFNISDMGHSNCYNPLNYIRDEAGVNMLIQCLITNTTQGEGGGDNQFFVDAEKLLYSACIFYLLDFCYDDTKKNFAGVMNMINASSVNEQDPNAKSPLDMLFDKLPQNSLAWKYYKAFKQAAGKTLKSIIISCVTRLQPFMTPQVVNLTKRDDLDLGQIGNEKTALFIITPQADRTYSFLASMLYSQLFETLYHIGEKQKANGESEQLHVPVRCMMDEFANIGEVPEFPSKLATMRKYNISAAIVLQDISQIEAMYQDNWKTLVGNCSTIVFLGTQEPNTLKYFSDMLGKKTVTNKSRNSGKGGDSGSYQQTSREVMTPDELGRMSSDECIVFTQNRRPVRDKKYKYETHPYYSQTADANNDYGFQYNKLSIYDNTRAEGVEHILKAQSEVAEYKTRVANKNNEIKDTKNVKIKGSPIDMFDKVQPLEKEGEKIYKDYLQECQIEAANYYDDPICILKVNAIPTNMLYKLVNQVSATLQKSPLMIFSDISIPEKSNYIVGVAIDNDDIGLEDILKNEYSKGIARQGKFIITTISKYVYDDYKDLVIQKISQKNI
jgi:type IV secretory pathway TraG/TraD family ATPase VirD4